MSTFPAKRHKRIQNNNGDDSDSDSDSNNNEDRMHNSSVKHKLYHGRPQQQIKRVFLPTTVAQFDDDARVIVMPNNAKYNTIPPQYKLTTEQNQLNTNVVRIEKEENSAQENISYPISELI